MADRICSIEGCGQKHLARGYCSKHYQQANKSGELANRPWEKLRFADALALAQQNETDEGCWPWHAVAEHGYPRAVGGHRAAHVAAYIEAFGPVPDGLTLDHLCHSFPKHPCAGGATCRHRRCVRPDHLEPVTAAEQQARCIRRQRPTCARGHLRTIENTRWVVETGRGGSRYRLCRRCAAEDMRRYRQERKAQTS